MDRSSRSSDSSASSAALKTRHPLLAANAREQGASAFIGAVHAFEQCASNSSVEAVIESWHQLDESAETLCAVCDKLASEARRISRGAVNGLARTHIDLKRHVGGEYIPESVKGKVSVCQRRIDLWTSALQTAMEHVNAASALSNAALETEVASKLKKQAKYKTAKSETIADFLKIMILFDHSRLGRPVSLTRLATLNVGSNISLRRLRVRKS